MFECCCKCRESALIVSDMNFLKNILLSIFVMKDTATVQSMSFPLRVKNECPEEGEIREYSSDVWKRKLIMLDSQRCGLRKAGISEEALKKGRKGSQLLYL